MISGYYVKVNNCIKQDPNRRKYRQKVVYKKYAQPFFRIMNLKIGFACDTINFK